MGFLNISAAWSSDISKSTTTITITMTGTEATAPDGTDGYSTTIYIGTPESHTMALCNIMNVGSAGWIIDHTGVVGNIGFGTPSSLTQVSALTTTTTLVSTLTYDTVSHGAYFYLYTTDDELSCFVNDLTNYTKREITDITVNSLYELSFTFNASTNDLLYSGPINVLEITDSLSNTSYCMYTVIGNVYTSTNGHIISPICNSQGVTYVVSEMSNIAFSFSPDILAQLLDFSIVGSSAIPSFTYCGSTTSPYTRFAKELLVSSTTQSTSSGTDYADGIGSIRFTTTETSLVPTMIVNSRSLLIRNSEGLTMDLFEESNGALEEEIAEIKIDLANIHSYLNAVYSVIGQVITDTSVTLSSTNNYLTDGELESPPILVSS